MCLGEPLLSFSHGCSSRLRKHFRKRDDAAMADTTWLREGADPPWAVLAPQGMVRVSLGRCFPREAHAFTSALNLLYAFLPLLGCPTWPCVVCRPALPCSVGFPVPAGKTPAAEHRPWGTRPGQRRCLSRSCCFPAWAGSQPHSGAHFAPLLPSRKHLESALGTDPSPPLGWPSSPPTHPPTMVVTLSEGSLHTRIILGEHWVCWE